MRSTTVVALTAAVAAAALSATAGASFPGANGRIVFATNRGPNLLLQVFSVPADGGVRRNLSRRPAFINSDPAAAPDRGGGLLFTSAPAVGPAPARIWLVTGNRKPRPVVAGWSPAWSPDGEHIAYNGPNGGLFILAARGGVPRLVADTGPGFWSPDGQRLAYTDGFGLSIVRVDGTASRELAQSLGFPNASAPSWSPDGRSLVVAARPEWDAPETRIYVIDLETGVAKQLAEGIQPQWSPDGRQIAFVHGQGLAVMNPDGTGVQARTTPPAGEADGYPAWSPDAHRLAFVRKGAVFSAVGVVGATAGTARLLTPGEGNVVEGSIRGLSWSADGRTIYYSSRSTRDVYHLFTVTRNLRGLRQLTRGPENDREPVWAPDGQRLAFVRDGRLLEIKDRKRIRAVARASGISSPTWSPDGRRLAYAAGGAVWSIRDDGRGRRRLLAGSKPAWSPAGGWLAYERDGIHVARTDGRDDRVVAPSDGTLFPTDPTWAPNGGVLFFIAEYRCDQPWLCGRGGSLRAIRPFTSPVQEIRLPGFSGMQDPVVSPDGRLFVSGGGNGLLILPRSGFGTSFGRSSFAIETEPDWQALRPPK